MISISKRAAYLRYAELQNKTGYPFELAAYIHPEEPGDRELLESNGWKVADPYVVTRTPELYQYYLSTSRGELCCPKPIYTELNTGWFSDRSACYLASGQPVLMEDTGISSVLPCGTGLLTFGNIDEAASCVEAINANYAKHSVAAREFAEAHLNSTVCLNRMISACY